MSARRRQQILLLLLALTLLAATFARPTLELERPTYRFVFVFDISQSMNVVDVALDDSPRTRLEFAKQTVVQALPQLPCGSEAGVALFTGHRAFLLLTPVEICTNFRELSAIIGNIDWRMTWEASSEIAKGLYKSIALMPQLDKPTSVVFISDGHEAPPLNPELPPTFTGIKGEITGLVIGVGGDTPVPIPKLDEAGKQQGLWQAEDVLHVDAYTNARILREGGSATALGNEHLSSLRASYLADLADDTGLIYHRLESAKALSQVLQSSQLGLAKTIATDMRWALGLAALCAFGACTLRGNGGDSRL